MEFYYCITKPLKSNKTPTEKNKYPISNGNKDFQDNDINWSYLYLGKIALVNMKKQTPNDILIPKTKDSGKKDKPGKDDQPPKKNIAPKALINSMLAYSAKKNFAKDIPEYSTLYSDTNSASGKSKGCLFVSASIEIKKINIIGANGIQYHILYCFNTICDKFKELVATIIIKDENPKHTS